MEIQVTSLRERKKAKTREVIIRTAMDLFAEKGFDRTTVDEIAAVAEISPRTFFRYFPTKEAVVFSTHAGRIAHFRELLAAHRDDATSARGVWSAVIEFSDEYLRNRDQLLREYRIVTGSPVLIARDVELDLEFEAAIADSLVGADKGDADAERRSRIFAGAVFGTIRAVLQEWFSQGCVADLESLSREAATILESGLAGFRTNA